MSAGVPKYVTINLGQLAERFSEGEEVSLATLKEKRVLNLSGKEAKLPLKARLEPRNQSANPCAGRRKIMSGEEAKLPLWRALRTAEGRCMVV